MQNIAYDPAQAVTAEVRREVADVVLDPDRWLITPNDHLGGREPINLLNSDVEADRQRVHDLIGAIRHGIFS
ncbi:MAG: DUF2384 domain-containing protein [Pyrinomonadaceae bacterium]|nr:DUF2384 domain-containing protein [Pyrinomonadaceae bacterium]